VEFDAFAAQEQAYWHGQPGRNTVLAFPYNGSYIGGYQHDNRVVVRDLQKLLRLLLGCDEDHFLLDLPRRYSVLYGAQRILVSPLPCSQPTIITSLQPTSIIKRAGVVPMSIAGIAKEVTTIAASAIVFGDELTPLNVTGVGITVAGEFFSPHVTVFLMERLIRVVPLGICLYTYHKYRKSIDSQVPLDLDGNPISDEDPDGGGVALDLDYIHESAPFNAEEARPLGLSTSLSSDGQRAHNAV
jgi:hypothetical protein